MLFNEVSEWEQKDVATIGANIMEKEVQNVTDAKKKKPKKINPIWQLY